MHPSSASGAPSDSVPEKAASLGPDPLAVSRALKEGRIRPGQRLDLVGASLVGADLQGIDLSGADLSGADLTRANLSGARLFRARLVGASLLQAKLEHVELAGADLTRANLGEAEVSHGGLGMAILRDATLFGARLHDATVTKAVLAGADLRCVDLSGARLREADLTGCDLTSADLREADMSLCQVSGASFNNADLRSARLRVLKGYRRAEWIGSDIRQINFAGAYLLRRFIVDQNYLKEFRDRGRLAELLYFLWWLSCDCGRSMGRWLAWIGVLVLLFAGIYSFVEVDWGHHPSPLSPLYYSVVTITTLGYGDVVPASLVGQAVAMVEVIIGYLMLGGLLSIFSNKIARRAE
jgi:uncharacterized protein YjbI with pentapeptide repeats